MSDAGKVLGYFGAGSLVIGGVGALAVGAYRASHGRPWKAWAVGGAVGTPVAAALAYQLYLMRRREAVVAAGRRDGVATRAKYPGVPAEALVFALQTADKLGPSFDPTWNSADKLLYRKGLEEGLRA